MAGSLWWIRRDLRLTDNPALAEALRQGPVTPVFILDPAALRSRYHRSASIRQAFLFDGLRQLGTDLMSRGSRLIVREGQPEDVLSTLMRETGADRVVAAEDYSPFARRRDARVAAVVPLTLTGGIAIRPPQAVLKADGNPFKVFTPFSKIWLMQPDPHREDLIDAPSSLSAVDASIGGVDIPQGSAGRSGFPAGEAAALERLERFAAGGDAAMLDYAEGRNMLGQDGTSELSPYLRFGMLSPRLAAVTAIEQRANATNTEGRRGASVWLNELIWRDFYLSVLYHFPFVLNDEFDESLRHIDWRNDREEIEAWQQGRTGYPVVDAAMRQLLETGWMHNRARMIVGSFLVKNLLCDWRIGEQWFMDHLLDGDPAANNGGWHWVAGVGTDAAPYFRVFNPVLQAKKFDPDGVYMRRWLPELADLSPRAVHEPWLLAADERSKLDYPAPIVKLGETRERALMVYKAAKGR